MQLTREQLLQCIPNGKSKVDIYLPYLNKIFIKYKIDSPLRIAHFLAQVIHESGSFRYSEEIASGAAYEGRKDLGNVIKGDGKKFKGRGLIQLTGRANYSIFSKSVGIDLLKAPELVAKPDLSVEAAGWYWDTHQLNTFADKDNINRITKRINGGLNGIIDRNIHLVRCKKVLGI